MGAGSQEPSAFLLTAPRCRHSTLMPVSAWCEPCGALWRTSRRIQCKGTLISTLILTLRRPCNYIGSKVISILETWDHLQIHEDPSRHIHVEFGPFSTLGTQKWTIQSCITDLISPCFSATCGPRKELSLGEMTIAFKGRSTLKVDNPKKFGYKAFIPFTKFGS